MLNNYNHNKMRKITQKAINNFMAKIAFSQDNTMVKIEDNNSYLYLHHNLIAKNVNNELFISNCGWFSNTTKERLNGLPGVSICQKNHIWYLNGKKWDGNFIKVN